MQPQLFQDRTIQSSSGGSRFSVVHDDSKNHSMRLDGSLSGSQVALEIAPRPSGRDFQDLALAARQREGDREWELAFRSPTIERSLAPKEPPGHHVEPLQLVVLRLDDAEKLRLV